MFIIYILQNAGFLSFPDQASCLEAWGSEGQKLTALRSKMHLRSMVAGGPGALSCRHLPLGLPGLQAACAFKASEVLLAPHIQSNGSFNGHNDCSVPNSELGPQERSGEKDRTWEGGRKLRESAIFNFSFHFILSGLILFSRWHHRALVLLCLSLYKLYFTCHQK